jgi:pimeloyl-ACP methyl ester carboxylesterase
VRTGAGATGIEVRHAEVGGRSIAYRIAGNGPPIILLHGFLCDSRVWEPQLADLSDAFTVIAWDAPGAGESSDPGDPFTTTDWAHCLADFLDVLGIGSAHVLGLSWGGMLAQELYRLHPERAAALILADTYAGWKGSLPAEAVEKRLARCLAESELPKAAFVARWVPVEFFTDAAGQKAREVMAAVVADFHPHGFRLMARALAETDTSAVLPTIAVPTLLLWGDADVRSPMTVAGQFRDAIPGAQLAIIAGAAHVSNLEQPDEFNAHVRRFCSSTLPG